MQTTMQTIQKTALTTNKTQAIRLSIILTLSMTLLACGGSKSSGGDNSARIESQQKLTNGLTKRSTDFYNDLQSKLTTLKTASNTFCSSPNDAGFETLRTEWKNAFSSWMSAQWIIRGPIDENFRFQNIQSWPLADSRKVAVSVNQDIANSAELTESYIANRPVQAQGLPALEYLLFSEGVDSNSISTRQCDLIKAISANILTISTDVNSEWGRYASDITHPGPGVQFRNFDASVNFFANLFLNQLIIIKDDKLGKPLGFNKQGQKGNPLPKKGEAWISRQSLTSVLNNYQSLQALYKDEGGFGLDDFLISLNEAEINSDISNKLSSIITKTQGLIDEGITLHDNADDSRLSELFEDAKVLEITVQNRMFPAIGASATFNFNDGD